MKCINCETDNNLKDRTDNQGKCKNCGTSFAFEPTTMPAEAKYTDPAFKKLLNDVSSGDTLFFTKSQLLCTMAKKIKRSGDTTVGELISIYILQCIAFSLTLSLFYQQMPEELRIIIFIIFLIGYSIFWFIWLWFQSQNLKLFRQQRLTRARSLQALGIMSLIFAGISISLKLWIFGGANAGLELWIFTIFQFILGGISVGLGIIQARRIPNMMEATLPITGQLLDSLLDQWTIAHGSPAKLLPDPSLEDFPNLPESDVTNYSFDRLIICQSDQIAQMLIANNFHFEYNCGIVSIGRYPNSIFDTVMTMAKRNSNLEVYVLHDCSPRGLHTLYTVKNSINWFKEESCTIIDVGISVRQVLSMKRHFLIQGSEDSMQVALRLQPEIRGLLTPEELQWLDLGNYILLETLSPKRIIDVLSRTISFRSQADSVEDTDSSSFILVGSDAGFYGVESFG